MEVADSFNQELIEDIQAAAPGLESLYITVLEGVKFSSEGISKLENLEQLQILEGAGLERLLLPELGELKHLKYLNIDIDERAELDEIDLSVLAGNESIEVIQIECTVKSVKLKGLSSCTKLRTISLIGINGDHVDFSDLSGSPSLTAIQVLKFGEGISDDIEAFKIILPQNIPLDTLSIADFMGEGKVDIDLSVLMEQKHIEMISLVNLNIPSFDCGLLSNTERIGQLLLDDNDITEIDITPIIEKPMNEYHGISFSVDEKTKVIIRVPSEKIERLIKHPQEKVTILTKDGQIEGLYGFQWLQYALDNYDIEFKE